MNTRSNKKKKNSKRGRRERKFFLQEKIFFLSFGFGEWQSYALKWLVVESHSLRRNALTIFFFAVSFCVPAIAVDGSLFCFFFPCDLLMFGCAAALNHLPCTESRVCCQILQFETVKRCIAFNKSIEELIKFRTREAIFITWFALCSFSKLRIIC